MSKKKEVGPRLDSMMEKLSRAASGAAPSPHSGTTEITIQDSPEMFPHTSIEIPIRNIVGDDTGTPIGSDLREGTGEVTGELVESTPETTPMSNFGTSLQSPSGSDIQTITEVSSAPTADSGTTQMFSRKAPQTSTGSITERGSRNLLLKKVAELLDREIKVEPREWTGPGRKGQNDLVRITGKLPRDLVEEVKRTGELQTHVLERALRLYLMVLKATK